MRKLKLPGRDSTRPRLDEQDIQLVDKMGVQKLKDHARRAVEQKLKNQPENDGKQTPTAGNPVYKAMHACNASSRKKLSMAHKIPAGKELKDDQIDSIVNLLTRWIVREHNFYLREKRKRQRSLQDF